MLVMAAQTNLTHEFAELAIKSLPPQIDLDTVNEVMAVYFIELALELDQIIRFSASKAKSPLFNWYSVVTAQAARVDSTRWHGQLNEAIHEVQERIPQSRKDLALGRNSTEPTESIVASRVRRRVDESDPIDLGIHPPIERIRSSEIHALPVLPAYVQRAHDAEIRRILEDADGSTMLVIVGKSSTGKTRAAYEAIMACVPDWHLFHPFDGTELVNFLSATDMPQTVIWLDEAQHYLDCGEGERVITGLRHVLADNIGPVIVVATMWPIYWTAFTAPRSSPNNNQFYDAADLSAVITEKSTSRKLLEMRRVYKINIPDDFTTASTTERSELERLARQDPRLNIARYTAGERLEVTQVLAGGKELVDRYENLLDDASRAIITAAMDARRLGHNAPLTPALLELAAPGYLSDTQRSGSPNWFETSQLRRLGVSTV